MSHDVPSLEALIRDVNATIMQHEIFLEADDRALAHDYLLAARKLVEVIREQGSEAEVREVASTGALPASTQAIAAAMNELLQARQKVLSRARAAHDIE